MRKVHAGWGRGAHGAGGSGRGGEGFGERGRQARRAGGRHPPLIKKFKSFQGPKIPHCLNNEWFKLFVKGNK